MLYTVKRISRGEIARREVQAPNSRFAARASGLLEDGAFISVVGADYSVKAFQVNEGGALSSLPTRSELNN